MIINLLGAEVYAGLAFSSCSPRLGATLGLAHCIEYDNVLNLSRLPILTSVQGLVKSTIEHGLDLSKPCLKEGHCGTPTWSSIKPPEIIGNVAL